MNTLRRRLIAASLAVLALALTVPSVLAHAELVESDPADGASIATPYVLVMRFDEELKPDESSIVVRDSAGTQVATGTTIEDNFTMAAELPALAPGAYQAHWIAITADDNGKTQGDVTFNVVAATAPPTATISPTTSATAAPPTGPPATTPSAVVTPAATPSPAATPAPEPSQPGGAELILPVVLAGAAVVGLVWFLLRRRPA